MVADWAFEQSGTVDIRKLWLFDNRLADAGAAAVARILAAHPGMQEVGMRAAALLPASVAAWMPCCCKRRLFLLILLLKAPASSC